MTPSVGSTYGNTTPNGGESEVDDDLSDDSVSELFETDNATNTHDINNIDDNNKAAGVARKELELEIDGKHDHDDIIINTGDNDSIGENENNNELQLHPIQSENVTKGNSNKSDIENGIGLIGTLDESKYQQWNDKEVLLWLKENLLNNGFRKEKAKEFLKEFKKMGITGGTLYSLKNSNMETKKMYFDELRHEFSNKNREFGIWLVIRTCIENINSNENMGQHLE